MDTNVFLDSDSLVLQKLVDVLAMVSEDSNGIGLFIVGLLLLVLGILAFFVFVLVLLADRATAVEGLLPEAQNLLEVELLRNARYYGGLSSTHLHHLYVDHVAEVVLEVIVVDLVHFQQTY